MMDTYTIHLLSTALSPITHMSGTAGNEAIIAREYVITDRGMVAVPFLSGNAIRHRAIREPGVMWLIEHYGLRDTLTLTQLNFLLHGGNLTESNLHENTARIARMYEAWPLLRLLGGCLPNQILAGSLDVWRGVLVCEENRRSLSQFYPDDLPTQSLYSAEKFITSYQYTRGDAGKQGIAQPDNDENPSNLMIFNGQCVQRGSMFVHGCVLKHVSELELGALLWSLRLWQAAGGTLGGQSSRGHGRLSSQLLVEGINQEQACAEYVAYALRQKDAAIEWLREAFK